MPNLSAAGASIHLLPPTSPSNSSPTTPSPLSSPLITVTSTFRLYRRRYFVLFIFSSLAFVNNVICYTFASISHLAKAEYPTISLSSLVTFFFLTYVVFSFPSSLFIERFGLRSGVVLGAWLQAIGSYLRWYDRGGPLMDTGPVCYLRMGQLVASLGQAFFVNPPPMMAAQWFGNDQRVLATTISVNANTLGIAGAYIFGSLMVRSAADIDAYLFAIFACSFLFALLATFLYPAAPPSPPSFSEHHQHKRAHHSRQLNPFSPRSILSLFGYAGFIHTCLGFAVAEAMINALSAFMGDILIPLGYSPLFVGVNAVGFIVMCMVGSAIVGYMVDRTRTYVSSVCACFVLAGVALLGLAWVRVDWATVIAVLSLGFFLGPIQPLVIETAVECTYPSPSSTVAAVQQVLGNVVSAMVFPVMAWMRGVGEREGRGMERVLVGMAVWLTLTAGVYSSFRGEYRRWKHETEGVLDRRGSDEGRGEEGGLSAGLGEVKEVNDGGSGGGGEREVLIMSADGNGQQPWYGSATR